MNALKGEFPTFLKEEVKILILASTSDFRQFVNLICGETDHYPKTVSFNLSLVLVELWLGLVQFWFSSGLALLNSGSTWAWQGATLVQFWLCLVQDCFKSGLAWLSSGSTRALFGSMPLQARLGPIMGQFGPGLLQVWLSSGLALGTNQRNSLRF